MKKPWLRWTLKILLAYLIACTPDMVKLVRARRGLVDGAQEACLVT